MRETAVTRLPSPNASSAAISRRALVVRAGAALTVAVAAVAFGLTHARLDWSEVWTRSRQAHLGTFLLALGTYYISFALRAVRWQLLLRGAGTTRCRTGMLGEIILIAWFANCVLPARLGDVYRAFLLRREEGVGTSTALGTIVAERIFDLFVLLGLLVAAGALVFHHRVPGALAPVLVGGTVLCMGGALALAALRAGWGRRWARLLPHRIKERLDDFRCGMVASMRQWPLLVPLTVGIWGLEAGRLALVVSALGLGGVLGPAQLLVVALLAALLSTVPFLPGGLGLVEGGMVLAMNTVGGVAGPDALSITLLDRTISYGSLVAVGAVVFTVNQIRTARLQTAGAAIA